MDDIDNQEPAWFIEEGIPGPGARPSWLGEKYKTASDLAKHTSELEKRLGTVPEDYDFSKSRYLDPDYEPFNELKKVAKEKRVPKEVMDKVIESVDKYMDEFSLDTAEELKKLGENAQERVTTLDNWAKANLSKESYEALSKTVMTADSIKAIEELRGKMMSNSPQVPTGNTGNVDTGSSVADLQLELANNLQKYKTDDAYRKDIQRRMEVAAKNAPGFVDKMGA